MLLLFLLLPSSSSLHFAVSSDIDGDIVRILSSYLDPFSILSFYESTPAVDSPDYLCHELSSGAFSALLPAHSTSLLILSSLSSSIGLPSFSISPIPSSRILSPPSFPTFSLYPTLDVLPNAIYSLLTQHILNTGSREVVVVYESNQDLDSIQYLLKEPVQAFLVQLPIEDDVRGALKYISFGLAVNQIVSFISVRRLHSFLSQAASMHMCTSHYHYIIANLDATTLALHSPSNSSLAPDISVCNITTFSLYQPNDDKVKEIRNVLDEEGYRLITPSGITVETSVIWDALQLVREAEDKLGVRGSPTCEGGHFIWEHGRSLHDYITNRTMEGLSGVSGPILFSRDTGQRLNVTLHMWKTTSNADFQQSHDWIDSQQRFVSRIVSHPQVDPTPKKNSLENHTLKVTVYLEEPFVMKRTPKEGEVLEGNSRYEGYCIDLLKMIASILKFEYVIHEVRDKSYGSREASGRWNGMVGELQNGDADLAVASLTISYSRSGVIDFSVPYMHLGISILFRQPESSSSPLSTFLAPLSPVVWFSVFLSYFLTAIVINCLSRISPYEVLERDVDDGVYRSIENQFTLRNAFWFAVSSLMQQGSELSPRANSVRVASAVWWMFTLILISSYTANLAAFLTTRRMVSPIENADDLSRQTKIKFGTLGRGSTMTFFNESRVDVYERMWKMMTSQPGLFVESSGEGIARVRAGDYAYLMESSMLEYAVERDCSLVQVGGLLDQKGYGIGLPKGSPYREPISRAILQLQEKTLLTELKEKWWKDVSVVCERPSSSKSDESSDDSSSLIGVFLLLLLGMLFSICIAVIERIVYSCMENEEETLLRRSLWIELRDALFDRGRDNEALKNCIDQLIREKVSDGNVQMAYENEYVGDSLSIEGTEEVDSS